MVPRQGGPEHENGNHLKHEEKPPLRAESKKHSAFVDSHVFKFEQMGKRVFFNEPQTTLTSTAYHCPI